MPKYKVRTLTDSEKKPLRPALTPEARENQLIQLAMDRAEEQLLKGTASSQLITHFLKLGSTREKLEQESLKKTMELTEAKKSSLESEKNSEELYKNALSAMKLYSGYESDAPSSDPTNSGDPSGNHGN